MMRAATRLALCSAVLCLTAAAASAQTTTTSETKKFQVIAVDGNVLVVRLPEGTREMTVPDDFRFNVDGKMLSVRELKPGMAGTATITTKTTVTPVTVTEVKNGTVMQNLGTSILVRTDDGMKMFSQSDIDKRGVKIMRDGQPAQISDFRANDRLTATIVTSKPPRVMTEKEVQATLAKSGGAAGLAPARPPPQARQGRELRRLPARQARARQLRARQPRARRPPAVRRGRCPRPPAPCLLLASQVSRRSWRAWVSPSGAVARRARGFVASVGRARSLMERGPRGIPGAASLLCSERRPASLTCS